MQRQAEWNGWREEKKAKDEGEGKNETCGGRVDQ